MIRDKNIEWKRESLFIHAEQFVAVTATAAHQTVGAGAPPLAEVSTFGYAGLLMESADDEGGYAMMVPKHWDPAEPLGFTVWWTSGSATTDDSVTWLALAKFFAEGATLSAPAALDTVIVADDVTGAYDIQKSSRGIKNANWLTHAQLDAGAFMAVNVEMAAFDVGLDEAKLFLGLEIDYMPRRCEPDYSS